MGMARSSLPVRDECPVGKLDTVIALDGRTGDFLNHAALRAARSRNPEAIPWYDRWSTLCRGEVGAAEGLFEEALASPREQRSDALALAHIYSSGRVAVCE